MERQIRDKIIEGLIQLTDLAYWEWNIRENNVYVSEEMYALFGIQQGAQHNNKRFIDFVHPQDREFVRLEIDRALKYKQPYQIEYRILHSSGDTKWIYEVGGVKESESGDEVNMLGILIDHSELRRSPFSHNRTYTKIGDLTSSYGLWEWDFLNNDVFLSHDACLILGFDSHQKKITKGTLLDMVDAAYLDKIKFAFAEAINIRKLNVEVMIRTSHSKLIKVNFQGEILSDRNPKIGRMFGIISDISELLRKEKAFLKAEKLSVVSELAAGVAHEILNPFTSIRGFIQLLNAQGVIKQSYSTIIAEEIDHLEFIVEELLMLAKPRVMEFASCSLVEVIQPVIEKITHQASQKDIFFTYNIEEGLPYLYCVGDQIRQLIYNLLENGLESMDRGGAIRLLIKREAPNKVRIIIEDEGKGIPSHLMEKLGEPFYTTKEKGTGLGLMVCYRIVDNHGGMLSFRRGEIMGTIANVILPINY